MTPTERKPRFVTFPPPPPSSLAFSDTRKPVSIATLLLKPSTTA